MVVRSLLGSVRDRLSPIEADPAFDPVFYRQNNPDLRSLSDDALARHYGRHGRAEGRAGNREEALARLIAEEGPLPPDFDPDEYVACNPDLATSLPTDLAATQHYLKYGRREKRKYFELNLDLYRDLYFGGRPVGAEQLREHYAAKGAREGLVRSTTDFVRRRGLPGRGRWIELIDLRVFPVVNWSWAPHVRTRLEAVEAMLSGGLERLAPISSDHVFDPAYYREAHPEAETASLDDVSLFKRWLFVGLDKGEAGSAAQHLRQLGLPLLRYPDAFDWSKYAVLRKLTGANRWSALDELLLEDASFDEVPVNGPGAVEFLTALAAAAAFEDDKVAVLRTRQAERHGTLSPSAVQGSGDALLRLERWAEALEAYEAVAKTDAHNVWTIVNGARAALKAERSETALDLLHLGASRFSGDANFAAVTPDVLEAAFDDVLESARALYGEGRRGEADAFLLDAVERTAEHWRTLAPTGALIPPASEARVVVLANTDLRQCTHYRVEQKVQILEAAGRRFHVFPTAQADAFMAALPGASAAIFYRLAALPTNLRAIDTARALGVTTYFEIDDLIFSDDYPDPIETYGGSITPEIYAGLQAGVPLFRAAMERCDYGIASTTALAEAMRSLVRTGEVFVLPNGLDDRNAAFALASPPRVRRTEEIVLFYGSGTKAHNSDFLELAGPAIAEIMAERDDVRLMVVGHLVLDERLAAFEDRITRLDFVPDARSYWSVLAEADINLAVLAPGVVTDAKSEIKWLEAAVLGMPSVVSATATYREVLEDGVDALLAQTADDWRAALRRLASDADLRKRIGEHARRKAVERYSLEANVVKLEALLKPSDEAAVAARAASDAPGRRKRVLVVNVFFPPQTIGGATRVVRDNLDAMLSARAEHDLEFAVVSTDDGARVPYRMKVDDYRGIPVFRIGAPQELNMDWRPLNPAMEDQFAEVLELWRPDLVHFHCIQRLTASTVKACVNAGVPYLVTLHDAWWVSDYQFLIDEKGRLRQPCEAIVGEPPAGVSVGESLNRRRVLSALLERAESLLAVSQTFADMYRACGFERTVAVPNGVTPAVAVERTRSESGRVRLLHVGGISAHKGFDLIQAALRSAELPHLELTVVDHTRVGGAEEHALWGATPVRIIGKTAQERVGELYARHDVLLAPSIWPESFGLVTREAMAAGLWVVASNLGAMGEDVVPGVNGWVVDVSSPAGLFAVLEEINRDPGRCLAAPPPTSLRTSEEQAHDLLRVYADTLAAPRRPVEPLTLSSWAGQPGRGPRAPGRLRSSRRDRMRERWGGIGVDEPPPGA